MTSRSEMTSSNSSDIYSRIVPRVEITSKINDDELKFTLSGVNVSIANSIRRIILSEIPMVCLLYTSPSPRDLSTSRMPSSA